MAAVCDAGREDMIQAIGRLIVRHSRRRTNYMVHGST